VPELPEVETIVRSLAPRLRNRRILEARGYSKFVCPEPIDGRLDGRTIRSVERRGKFIVCELDSGWLSIHLGMTGKLLIGGAPGPYTRAVFTLDDGVLVYDDVRHFGRIEWSERLPARIAKLGPEPLELGWEEFRAALRARKTRLKPLLLNQRFLRGMGNIYVDEALFRARLHPKAIASRLSAARARRLFDAIREVLALAIQSRGSSVSDYVDAEGRRGGFQLLHEVYGKEGEPCPNCGFPIRRIVVAQRGTHYCPDCQRV
jgi:formamidopyrimidine-DNA glycosylase